MGAVTAGTKEGRTCVSNVSYKDEDGVAEVSRAGGKEGDGWFNLCFGDLHNRLVFRVLRCTAAADLMGMIDMAEFGMEGERL